jgi:transcriptional regulator with XRE-family HTH domain
MSKRSYQRIPSREGKILRHMRQKSGLSMRQAAARIGLSPAMISHVEIGRENLPKNRIGAMVQAYGYTIEQFREFMSGKVVPTNLRDECLELIRVMDESKLQPIHIMITAMMQQGGRK